VGDKLLFREGRTKGLGVVTATGYDRTKLSVERKDRDQEDKNKTNIAGGGGNT
jgi:hypothetical protein